MIISILLIVAGFVLLVVGGEVIVRSAVQLAERLGLSTFVIGAVIIGFGSSTPELVTSIEAGLLGSPGIALGNIVGSNIINVLVVVGITAVVSPIVLTCRHTHFDTVIVCAITAGFVALCTLLELSPAVGAVLLIALAGYLIHSLRRAVDAALHEPNGRVAVLPDAGGTAVQASHDAPRKEVLLAGIGVIAGLALLITGGHLVVGAAVALAKLLGLSQVIIGLTVVAFGTSLPEIVTAVIAAVRRHADMALGNVLGSCVFNLLAIGGGVAIFTPADMPVEIIRFDNVVMLAAIVLLLAAISLSRQLGRLHGMVFLTSYVAYLSVAWP